MTHEIDSLPITPGLLHVLTRAEEEGSFRLRDEDAQECIAVGMTPMAAIDFSVRNSLESFAVTVDGQVLVVWGYGTRHFMADTGYPWLLTSPLVEKHRFFFARTSQSALSYLHRRFRRLEVFVDARYLRAQAWLEWLGFNVEGPAIGAPPFVWMTRERNGIADLSRKQ